jgi:hypothetical protein
MGKVNVGAPKIQNTGPVVSNAAEKAGKWKKYIFGVVVNALLWAFIALGFFVIVLASNKLGITKSLPAKVASVAKFFDATFVAALLVGAVLMALALMIINDIFIKLRDTFPKWKELSREIISDREFGQYCHSEVFSQINNLANLSLLAGIFFQMDKSRFGNSILEFSAANSIELIVTAGVLYLVAAFFYWLYGDLQAND